MKKNFKKNKLALIFISTMVYSGSSIGFPVLTCASGMSEAQKQAISDVNEAINKLYLDPEYGKMSSLAEMKLTAAQKGGLVLDAIGKIGLIAGLGMSVYEILDAYENHKSSEYVEGGLTLGMTLGPELLSSMMAQLVSEEAGSVAGGASAALLSIGLNIYTGIKVDNVLKSVKKNNSDLGEHYKNTLRVIESSLDDSKRIVSGDAIEYQKLIIDNFGKSVVQLTKKGIHEFATELVNRKIALHAPIRDKDDALTHNILSNIDSVSPINKDDFVNAIKEVRRLLVDEYQLHPLSISYPEGKIRFPSDYVISKHYGYSGLNTPLSLSNNLIRHSPGISSMYSLYKVVMKKTNGLLELVDAFIDNKESLLDDYHKISSFLLSDYYKLQQDMVEQYNKTILEKYIWLKFGEELIGNIDYSVEETARDMEWAIRVLMPIAGPVVDSLMDEKLVKSINVAALVNSVITELMGSKIDINMPSSLEQVKKVAVKHALPAYVGHSLEKSFHHAKKSAVEKTLSSKDIKPIAITSAETSEYLNQIRVLINNGTLKKQVDDAVSNYIYKANILPNLRFKYYQQEAADKASRLHWNYIESLVSIIDLSLQNIEKSDTLKDEDLMRLAASIKLNHEKHLVTNSVADPDYKYLNFTSLGQTRNEMNSIVGLIDRTLKNSM